MQKKIDHILLISSSFPTTKDGSAAAGSFVNDFAVELCKFTKVTVLAPGNSDNQEKYGNLTVLYFKVPTLPLSLLKIHNPAHWLYIFQTIRAGSTALNNLLKRKAIDHILALWVLPSGFWAYRAHRKFGVPFSCWALGSDIWAFQHNYFGKILLRNILCKAQYNFADGLTLKKDVTTISGRNCEFLPSSRILFRQKLPNQDNHTGTRLAYLGRWHPNKGVDLFLDALAYLTNKDWEHISEVTVAGGGPLEELVRNKYEDLQHNNRPIRLLGYLNKKEASDLIEWTDYLVIPSRIESIPVILSDAIQLCTPVVATPAGDIPLFLKKYNLGILSKSIAPESLANSIKLALKLNPNQFKKYILAAQPEFNIHSIAKKFYSYTVGQA